VGDDLGRGKPCRYILFFYFFVGEGFIPSRKTMQFICSGGSIIKNVYKVGGMGKELNTSSQQYDKIKIKKH
jgi:hypothetical protein